VSRVPTFAGVGRLGLPLVAVVTGVALWSTSWALATGRPGRPVSVALPDKAQVRPAAAQLGVSIPAVAFGSADGLAARLTAGSHVAVVDVWLAAGSSASLVTVSSTGAHVSGCSAVRLLPAVVNKLHCAVDADRSFTLSASTSVAGHAFQTSYRHLVE
jgi:hypothetical protein